VDVLRAVLHYLGVGPDKLRYRAAAGPNEWDPIEVCLDIAEEPRAGINYSFRAVQCLESAPSLYLAIQRATNSALRRIARDYWTQLEGSRFRFLPRDLPTDLTTVSALQAMEYAPDLEEDLCLRMTARCLLEQSRYLHHLEQEHSRTEWHYQSTVELTKSQEAKIKKHEKDRELLLREIMECQRIGEENTWREHYQRVTAQQREEQTQAKHKELEEAHSRQKEAMDALTDRALPLIERNKRLERRVAYLEKLCNYNAVNLTNLLRISLYLLEKEDRQLTAWKESDARRVREIHELRDQLPLAKLPKVRRENFGIPSTQLMIKESFRRSQEKNHFTPELARAFRVADTLFPGSQDIRKRISDFEVGTRIIREEDSDEEMQILIG
jgi:hypothetical protein